MTELNSSISSFGDLSEEAIKQRFVPFLKDFYRKRYEPISGSESVELDNIAEGGVVADGKMSFRKGDGSPFVCTYEASSRDKSEEVKFKLNINYFLWDCAAFGTILAAIAYVGFYVSRLPWLITLHVVGNLGLLIGLGMIGFFGWYFTMQGWKKYRFIHAVAQFKQYFADEQWIALGEDVFPSPLDPYLVELRNQCVYHGFGLALVPAEGNVRILVTPSRLGVYGKDRKMAHWVTRQQWYQGVSQSMGMVAKMKPPDQLTVLWNRMTRPVHYLAVDPIRRILGKPFGQTASVYTQFMQAQGIQKWLMAAAFLVLIPLFTKVISHRDINEADLEKLQSWRSSSNPEDQYGYVVDGDPIPYEKTVSTGITKQYPIPANRPEEDDVQEINLSGDDEEEEPNTINLSAKRATTPPPAPKTVKKATAAAVKSKQDPCAAWEKRSGWLIQDNAFGSTGNADSRLAQLRKQGITAEKVSQQCLGSSAKGYIVYIGTIQKNEAAARKMADSLEKSLKKAGLGSKKLLLRKI
jgi:cell division septation protein DedD